MKSRTNKIIVSIIALVVILVLIAVGFRVVGNPSSNKDQSSKTIVSKSSTSISSKSSQSTKSSSPTVSSSKSSSSAAQRTQWASLDLVHQIAILIQAAFPNQNGRPNSQFDFASNYWDMTGSINNGEINRYVPKADSFAGMSDILSAKIRIENGQIQVTRPITAAFSISINQAMADYYTQTNAVNYTNNLSSRVVNPARLAELQKNH